MTIRLAISFSTKRIFGLHIAQDMADVKKIILFSHAPMENTGCFAPRKNSLKEYFLFMDTLDPIDLQILRTLQENSQLTTKELARCVNLSSTPVFERLKRLERKGYIKKYVAILDAEKLNQGFRVFCTVQMTRINREIAAEFTRKIQSIPEVTECYNIAGDYDYLLKIHTPDMKYYQEFVLNVLGTIDHLGSIHSIFVMDEIKKEYGIHI